ncbi:MAG: DUF2442 domain-containing protein [Tepidimonas ignava]|uniref:DUF2442 domain-containing protein n=1 Tax=Tepidimonas ignava TaxID=114249 RepID=UPI002A2998B1|nr:DUF2442 domain-containing protein [Tepidimonas ignava]
MPTATAPVADCAVGLTPDLPPVVAVRVLQHGVLEVRFADGCAGCVEILPSHMTGVFAPLRDPAVFAQVGVVGGAVSWPEGVDLAPDAMYQAIVRNGRWVLE